MLEIPEENMGRIALEVTGMVVRVLEKCEGYVEVVERFKRNGVISEQDWMRVIDVQDTLARFTGYKDALRATLGDEFVSVLEQTCGFIPKDIPQDLWTTLSNLRTQYHNGRFNP
jgi:hypothetical protein